MSRRRRPKASLPASWKSLTIKCDGSRARPHSDQRVATVHARWGHEGELPVLVRVEYGNRPTPHSETGAHRPVGPVGHMTHRLPCGHCGEDLPIKAEKLGVIVMGHAGTGSLRLAEIRSMLS